MIPHCDRCGPGTDAKWIIFVAAGMLYFCQHHRNQYRQHVIKKGYRIAKAEPIAAEQMEDW